MPNEHEGSVHGHTHGQRHGVNWLQVFDENAPLARAYVPFQRFGARFSPEEGLRKGTLFPELYSPYGGWVDGGQGGELS